MFFVLSGMLHFELELRNSYLGILQQSDSYMIREGIAELVVDVLVSSFKSYSGPFRANRDSFQSLRPN